MAGGSGTAGLQDRGERGVVNVGEIVRIDPEARSFVMESVPVGRLGSSGRRVSGEVGIPGIDPFPPPDQTARGPADPRIPPPSPSVPRPAGTRVPVSSGQPIANRSAEGRAVREGYRSFHVSTNDETELDANARVLSFDALAVGDRVTVLGSVDGDRITAYRIERSTGGGDQPH